ncbi:MAG: transcriptional regulator GcvA [Candidatus Competibacteraceae bacterium]|jgi:LysR family glycine cleavage system transcriptional activator|nr:transcriptional regulator GcvA [Candidatus Competibacteraceae bacterium]
MSQRLPPLNALRAFETAARHLSFKQAAEELNVTPAAVSQQIKQLEHYLDIELFQRSNRMLQLTDIGRRFLPKLQEGFACFAAAMEEVTGESELNVLTVSVAPSFAAKWLVPRMNNFITVHPKIDIRVSASMTPIDLQSVVDMKEFQRDGVDLTVRFGRGQYPGFRVDKLFAVSIVPMCSPRLLEGAQPLSKPEDLRYHTLLHDEILVVDDRHPDWRMWLEEAGVEGVDTKRGQHFNHTALALEAAVEGQGVVLSIKNLALADLAAGRLVVPFDLDIPLEFAYYIVCPEATADEPNIVAFREWLLAEAEQDGSMH